jgi:hypothetical protein
MTQYTFSAVHRTFSKIDHILGNKASLSKYKKIEITSCILSDQNALKLEVYNKNNSRKYTNNCRLNNKLINDQCIIVEIREEIKSFLEANENQNTMYQNLGHTAKAVLRRKFITMYAYIKGAKRSKISTLMLHVKLLEEKEQAKLKTRRRREEFKMRTKINKIETKKYKESTKEKAVF